MRSAEIVIAGAGPAGIAAACCAAESKQQVAVIDDNPTPGGQIWRGGNLKFGRFQESGAKWIPGTRILSGDAGKRTLLLEDETSAYEIQYEKLIIATGAREVFLPFPGWSLPNVIGAGGMQALVKGGLSVKGKRIIVAGSGPLLLAVAAYLRKRGAIVPLIAEQTPSRRVLRFALNLVRSPRKAAEALALRASLARVRYVTGCWVEAAEGDAKLSRVRLRQASRTWTEQCDYLAIGYGLCPNSELAELLGCELQSDGVKVDEFQKTSVDHIYCAGETTGIGGVELSLAEGQIAGYSATAQIDSARKLFTTRKKAQHFASALNEAFALRSELKSLPLPDTILCRCEDVTLSRLQPMSSWREAKLHTRCGMGPCQGRICGPATHFLFGWNSESIRPPIFPARIESLIEEGTTQ
jgi:NADPH-dependent 2,4-dienoyl-CoA reductase/sulfur reductase-like enzyme